VHFRDTMRGGKFLNNPRMAELHAREAPDRVYELQAWGAVFDRTKDGKISQRNFGGHEPAIRVTVSSAIEGVCMGSSPSAPAAAAAALV
jgi:succinate dehydrogenase/fumarate reductase flavoprotein subunit